MLKWIVLEVRTREKWGKTALVVTCRTLQKDAQLVTVPAHMMERKV